MKISFVSHFWIVERFLSFLQLMVIIIESDDRWIRLTSNTSVVWNKINISYEYEKDKYTWAKIGANLGNFQLTNIPIMTGVVRDMREMNIFP